MDKQKQIEEMAKDICGYCLKIIEEKECPRNENQYCFKSRLEEATYAYDLGYRKIPENAGRTEDESDERIEDLMTEFDEMGFYPLTTCQNAEKCVSDWKLNLIKAIGQLKRQMLKDCIESNEIARKTYYERGCKETAEKIAKRLKEKLNDWLEDNEGLDGKIDFGIANIELIGVESLEGEVISKSLIDEICKEFTEGKE